VEHIKENGMSHNGHFLPRTDAGLLAWSLNFDNKITADPTIYGLTVGQATAYDSLHQAFAEAYNTANTPVTRTPPSIVAKRDAKRALVAEARKLAAIVQAFPGTSNTMRSELGLTVRDDEPTPVPPPSESPEIDIVSAVLRTVRVRMHNEKTLGRRGKPHGVQGATVLSYIGPVPPAPEDIHLWKFEGNTTRTSFELQFPSSAPPGTTVWITAFWYNPRGESGPATPPVYTILPGSLQQAA
jgi:hypothetical protein